MKRALSPPGRTKVLTENMETLKKMYSDGLLALGQSVRPCNPDCGDIVVKMSNSAQNPNRPFAACPAQSHQKHNTFFWLDEEKSNGPQVEPEKAPAANGKVPHCILEGVLLCIRSVLD